MGNRFHTTTTTTLIAGSLLLLAPACVFAAGLGKLSVLSALGQPLRAEIDIVAMQPEESESLAARIAAPETFKQAGVDYGAVVPQLRAAIEHRADGRAVLALKSVQPVNEPFVDVLVELDSATGHLVRQYTFLLDPVGYKGPEPAVSAPAVAPAPVESSTAAVQGGPVADVAPATSLAPMAPSAPASEKSLPQPAAVEPTRATVPTPATAVAAAGVGVEVKKGDTLAAIAEAHRPQDVSLQRMLVALYQANAEAFIKNNMNLVRAGAILRIPDAAELEGVAQADAVHVVNTQARAFNAYRASLAAAVAAGPAGAEGDQQRAAGRITTMVEEKPAAAAAGGDELRLSRATEGKGAAAVTSAGDDATAGAKALQEADERVAELERNVKDLQKLLELKNSQLAALQQHAQGAAPAGETALATTQGEAAAAPVETPPAAATEAHPDGAEGTAAAPEEQANDAAAPAAEATAEAPAAEPAKAVAKPAKKKKVAPPPPPEEPSFVDSLLDDPVMTAGGGGAIVALLLGLLVWRRKRAAAANASLVGLTTTDSSSVFGTTGGRSVDTGASALQTDFDQSGIGSIDTEEVDPVAEADVYMAYGRDVQAEEILKEALQKDPNRQAVRVKLLEIYASRKDAQAFAATAAEVKAATHGEGADWEKVAALGQTVDPGNALYGASASAPAADVSAPVAAASPAAIEDVAPQAAPAALDFEVSPASAAPAAADSPLSPAAVSQAFDLDLGPAGQDGVEAPAAAVSQALDLDLDLNLGSDAANVPTEVPADFSPSGTLIMDAATKQAVSELGEVDHGLDFNLDVPTIEQKPGTAATAATGFGAGVPSVPAVDLSGLSLDVEGDAETDGDAGWQEVATKLDLAKAYEEMGDKEGARELLNEVIKEGDGTQQAQARTMLEALR